MEVILIAKSPYLSHQVIRMPIDRRHRGDRHLELIEGPATCEGI
jgi:hypothetical protein